MQTITKQPEYLKSRPTYKQRIAVIKAEAKQIKRTKQLNKTKEILLILVGFVLVVLIIGLVEGLEHTK